MKKMDQKKVRMKDMHQKANNWKGKGQEISRDS
jgi:hypothetical protein